MSKPIFQRTRVEQTIDLQDAFGIDFKGLRSLREAIGEAILSRIRQRTSNGEQIKFDALGRARIKSFTEGRYSDEYADTLDFKAFGKSQRNVNMTLTGDMLGLMDIKRQSGNSITIGWTDATENAKAYNHSIGDTVPERPFFGISKGELEDIKGEFSSEIRDAIKVKNTEGQRAFEERVGALLDRLSSPEASGIGAQEESDG